MKQTTLFLVTILSLAAFLTGAPALAAERKKSASNKPKAAPMVTVHTHSAATDTFAVNSHLLETAQSLILIDTQMTVSEATKVQELITKLRKPLVAIFITHPHPDHYNNIGYFLKNNPKIPVYATAATSNAISTDDARLRAYWSPFYRNDYPSGLTLPTRTVKAGETLTFDHLSLQFDEMGAGEASNSLLIYLPATKALFVGDLVYSGAYANIREGRSKSWLANLDMVKKKYPAVTTIYPGHGPSGKKDLLRTQAEYLTKLRDLIRSRLDLQHPRVPIASEMREQVRASMAKTYPYMSYLLLELSLEPVIAELLAEAGYKPQPEEDEEDEI
jgi:glyoxylase-like metal-dependent hydrolase (beta-lactamase superfamily II)